MVMGKADTFFLLFFALAIGSSMGTVLIPFKRHYVRIVNLLDNKQLDYHCKSKNDDFGHRILPPNGEWEFKFRSIFGTKFDCIAWYSNFHYMINFTSYELNEKFEADCGGAHCIWKFVEDGIYLHNDPSDDDKKMFPWKRT